MNVKINMVYLYGIDARYSADMRRYTVWRKTNFGEELDVTYNTGRSFLSLFSVLCNLVFRRYFTLCFISDTICPWNLVLCTLKLSQ